MQVNCRYFTIVNILTPKAAFSDSHQTIENKANRMQKGANNTKKGKAQPNNKLYIIIVTAP